MKPLGIALALSVLTGCVPRSVVVHDGLECTVIDAETDQALSGAFAFDRVENGQPHMLAQSDESGQLRLSPQSALTFTLFLSEGMIALPLWVCKAGYKPVLVGKRLGWNADYAPNQIHRPGSIALSRALPDSIASCSSPQW